MEAVDASRAAEEGMAGAGPGFAAMSMCEASELPAEAEVVAEAEAGAKANSRAGAETLTGGAREAEEMRQAMEELRSEVAALRAEAERARAFKAIESDERDEVRAGSPKKAVAKTVAKTPKTVAEVATMTSASLTSLPRMVDAAAGTQSAAPSPSRPSSVRGAPSRASPSKAAAEVRSCDVQSSLGTNLAAALSVGSDGPPPSPGLGLRSVDYASCNTAATSPAKSPAKSPAASPAKATTSGRCCPPGSVHVTPPSTPLLQSNSSPSCAGARFSPRFSPFSPVALQKTPPSTPQAPSTPQLECNASPARVTTFGVDREARAAAEGGRFGAPPPPALPLEPPPARDGIQYGAPPRMRSPSGATSFERREPKLPPRAAPRGEAWEARSSSSNSSSSRRPAGSADAVVADADAVLERLRARIAGCRQHLDSLHV